MKPQTTGNIGFFKGCLFLFLFSLEYPLGIIIQLLCAIFDKGDIGKFVSLKITRAETFALYGEKI